MPKITVIIPTFNRLKYLTRALNSVLSQTFKADEIIVVVDGSTDNTVEMLQNNYPALRVLYQENKGVSAARNFGILESSNDWLAFLDDDDEWLPQKLEKQMQLLHSQPEILFCHTQEQWVRNGVRVNQMSKHHKSGGWIYQKCLPLCAISPSSVLLHKSLFEQVGLFREDLPACEDYDMWLKICSRNPVLFVEQACLIKYGGHEDQLSAKYWGMDRFRIDALKNRLDEKILNAGDEKATLNMLQKKVQVFIKGARKRNKNDDVLYYEKMLNHFGLEK